ncbi:hypothetical protein HMPREF9440_02435 [Sutterella parvirubra YIT 11816]|uniref:Uncharacterized protein n=1 Tax=Sutterella parvirubra YIT 11816 TaxID=762967 RepID=H3KI34_9BURK|nr:hypothetical protein HMPREF9440_02435 [Sutterella parvirubra YIT 11816]
MRGVEKHALHVGITPVSRPFVDAGGVRAAEVGSSPPRATVRGSGPPSGSRALSDRPSKQDAIGAVSAAALP